MIWARDAIILLLSTCSFDKQCTPLARAHPKQDAQQITSGVLRNPTDVVTLSGLVRPASDYDSIIRYKLGWKYQFKRKYSSPNPNGLLETRQVDGTSASLISPHCVYNFRSRQQGNPRAKHLVCAKADSLLCCVDYSRQTDRTARDTEVR